MVSQKFVQMQIILKLKNQGKSRFSLKNNPVMQSNSDKFSFIEKRVSNSSSSD